MLISPVSKLSTLTISQLLVFRKRTKPLLRGSDAHTHTQVRAPAPYTAPHTLLILPNQALKNVRRGQQLGQPRVLSVSLPESESVTLRSFLVDVSAPSRRPPLTPVLAVLTPGPSLVPLPTCDLCLPLAPTPASGNTWTHSCAIAGISAKFKSS